MAKRSRPGCGGHAWRRRLASERAIALPTSVMLMMIVLLLAAAVGTAAINASGQSSHDRGTKRAVAAADAGLDTALYRLNKLEPPPLMCVSVDPTDPSAALQQVPVQSNGWCAPTEPEDLGDGATFSYEMSFAPTVSMNGQGLLQRKIVATGTANGVTRRAMATVGSVTGVSLFGGNAVTSLEGLTLPTGTRIIGDAATDGSMALQNCSQLAGNALVGPGEQFTVGGAEQTCSGFTLRKATQNLVLNPVDAGRTDEDAYNDNDRIGAPGGDPLVLTLGSSWNATNRVLRLRNSSTLTLTGDTYSFCSLEISNLAQLTIAPRLPTQAPVKVYIDSPENCGLTSSEGKVTLGNSGSITNLNATADTLLILAVGSPTDPPTLEFSQTATATGLVYAPRSTVALSNSAAIIGSVAAKSVTLANTSRVEWDPSADITIDDLLPLFKRTSWVECTSKRTGPDPDSGC